MYPVFNLHSVLTQGSLCLLYYFSFDDYEEYIVFFFYFYRFSKVELVSRLSVVSGLSIIIEKRIREIKIKLI